MTDRPDAITLSLRVQLPWETDAGTEQRQPTITSYVGPLVRVEVAGTTWYRHAETVRKQLAVSHA